MLAQKLMGALSAQAPTSGRVYHHAEVVAAADGTVNADNDKVTLTFTPQPNSTYLLFWSIQVQMPTFGDGVLAYLKIDGVEAVRSGFAPRLPTDWAPMSGMYPVTYGESPSSTTVVLGFRGTSVDPDDLVSASREARIFALKLESSDRVTSLVDVAANTTTTFSDAATLSWTPETTGDYLIIASAQLQFSTTSGEVIGRVTHSGTSYGTVTMRVPGITTDLGSSGLAAVRLNALSGSQSVAYQVARSSTATGTARARKVAIAALRLDGFTASYIAEERTRATTTSTAYSNRAATASAAIAAEPHLLLATCVRDHNSTSNGARTRVALGTTALIQNTQQGADVASTTIDVRGGNWGQLELFTGTGAPGQILQLQYSTSTSGTSTGIADACVAVLQLT